MPRKSLWTERSFSFDLPLTMFPNLLERLRGTPARVEERVAGLTAAQLRTQVGGKWSIQEIVGHLGRVEGLWLGRLDDYAQGLARLRPADMSNRRTVEADFNAQETGAVLADFRAVRGEFVARLERLPDEGIGRSAHHPRLDRPMRLLDLMVFAAEHDDHHLAGITELLETIGNG
jgi:uncharacterized damage-inducible protein DinB